MVASSFIDIHTLTLDELSGVVNLYPWYGAARVELSRRMARLGSWEEDEYAAQALYVPDRGKLAPFVRTSADCSDKDVQRLLAAYIQPSVREETEGGEGPSVRVVGGDYFSQAQYDRVKESGDSVFSRLAMKPRQESSEPEEVSEIADRFATETLARIFAEQGRIEEAKRIYSRLVLDIPEKSAYFTSLIENLE